MASVVRWLCVALVAGLAVGASGQQAGAQAGSTGTLTGRVVDSVSKAPIGSVTLAVVGTRLGGITRDDGSYTIVNIPTGTARVRVTRIGYQAKEQDVTISAGGTTTLNFNLNTVATQLNQVVVVGYGQQRREAVTGSVSQIDAEQANVGVIANANQMVQGRVAGVSMTQNNGEPGGGAQIRIRGGTSLSASNDPLYVVDGVPLQNEDVVASGNEISGSRPGLSRSPLNTINPNDIESITVLKDAAATAIYGSRGANGVVLITTKRGNSRTSNIEYEVYASASTPSNHLDLMTGADYRAFVQEAVANNQLPAASLNDLGTANTDWERELMRTGYATNHNLAFSGGSATTQYRASLNYFSQQGVVLSNGLKRYQGRINGQHQSFGGRLNLGLNLTASRVNNDFALTENTGGFTGGIFTNMAIYNPTKPVYGDDGRFYETSYTNALDVRNPVAIANQVQEIAPENRILGNMTGSIALWRGLTSQTTFGVDYTNSTRQTYCPRVSPLCYATQGYARQAERSLQTLNLQQLLTFNSEFKEKNTVEVVGGYEYSQFDNSGFDAIAQRFVTDQWTWNSLGSGASDLFQQGSYEQISKLVSFFGRANYGLLNKYFVTAVLRQDGSSRLAQGHQWSTFPALSASWRLSEESFMASHPLGLTTLALRAGWGKQGNQAVKPYGTELLLKADNGARYPFGTSVTQGLVATQLANEDLKWETAAQTNVGLDFGFRENRITGVLDFYEKKTHDLLLEIAVPQPAVVSTRLENVGSIKNRGMELSLDADLYERNTRTFSSGLVLSVERNEVTDIGGRPFIETGSVSGQGQSGRNSQRIIKGQPIGTFWGATFLRVNDAGKQVFRCQAVRPECVNGETTSPFAGDDGIIGNANPDFTLGLRSNGRWGKFDASWLWRAEVGKDVFNNTALLYQSKSNASQGRNFLKAALDDGDAIGEPSIYSSRWIEDGSFVRLQNITLGYTMDIAGLGAGRQARFYVSGDNLLLFTGYSGYDPEVFVRAGDGVAGTASRGIDYLTYPRARTFTAGTRFTF